MLKCCGEVTAAGNYCSSIKGDGVILIWPSWSPALSSPSPVTPLHPSRQWGPAGKVSRNSAFSDVYLNLAGFPILAASWELSGCEVEYRQGIGKAPLGGWFGEFWHGTAGAVEAAQRARALGLVSKVIWKLLRSGKCGVFCSPSPFNMMNIDGKCSSPVYQSSDCVVSHSCKDVIFARRGKQKNVNQINITNVRPGIRLPVSCERGWWWGS